jgi:outer membrane protein W
MKSMILFFLFQSLSHLYAQPVRIHFMAGLSNYMGDVKEKTFSVNGAYPVITAGATFNITDKWIVRGDASYTHLGAEDRRNSSSALRLRNLKFKTVIHELALMAEYDIFNLKEKSFSPYFFAGIGVFHFAPFTQDSAGRVAWLLSLSTEGQGFPEYPDRKVANKIQLNIPFGGGIKYMLSDEIQIGFDIGIRKLFTDYLDDVSTTYVDKDLLRARKGEQAVSVAFRGDELKTSPQFYPAAGTIRGNSKRNDYYYFGQLRVSFRLNWFYKIDQSQFCPRTLI